MPDHDPVQTRSDRSRALATRLVLAIRDEDPEGVGLVLAEADRTPRGLFDLVVATAALAAARISDEDAPALVAEALDRLGRVD
ncbi:hypothetical protein [Gordonia amarae]|uniref:hypothetical protein n=1 Tax=Gordonia amarae TaxID=36821 RepID=UPI001AF9E0BD|nr:hypothetical protein [Gordonia amarae]QHN17865.1 hypothetical protein GII35_13585 [Gordonia amarae]QHN17938.1 hypothetical protein GII35_14070 [Gordonia amarae]QHN22459.1 hypothetical protein GII34_13815 [Gordonia amarae]